MTDHPPPLRVVVGVGVVAGTTLALQVLLTRLLSAVFLYHFAFLAISLALLGTGGGALLVYVRERRGDAGPVEPLLARYGIAFAVFLLALAAVGLALAALAQSGSQFQLPISAFPIGGTRPVAVRWTPLSRVIGFAPASARVAGITYDRDGAPVPLYRRGQPPLNWRALGLGPQSIPYTLTPPGKTLVIGGGG